VPVEDGQIRLCLTAGQGKRLADCVQCWTSLEEFFGVVPCQLMSMMSESLLPSAARWISRASGDVHPAISLRSPAAIDWNNNYADEANKCILFHCSNLPNPSSRPQNGLSADHCRAVGKDILRTVVAGFAGTATFLRTMTTILRASRLTGRADSPTTRSNLRRLRVIEIPSPDLMQYVCQMGFEHTWPSTSARRQRCRRGAWKYLAWDIYNTNNTGHTK